MIPPIEYGSSSDGMLAYPGTQPPDAAALDDALRAWRLVVDRSRYAPLVHYTKLFRRHAWWLRAFGAVLAADVERGFLWVEPDHRICGVGPRAIG